VTGRSEVDNREMIKVNILPMPGNKLPEASPEVNRRKLILVTAKGKMMYNVKQYFCS
jgi:hypothetical protein